MSETGADIDAWPIPKVYLKYAPPDLVKDYETKVCALIYHVIRGVVDVEADSVPVPACLRYVPEALLKEYGAELPEILGRAALGYLNPSDSKPSAPPYLAKLTPAEVEEWGENLFRLTGGIAESFRIYPFLQSVPQGLLRDYGEPDTVDFVATVVRGMIEGRSHPEWPKPHIHYMTPTMREDWGAQTDTVGRLVRGVLESQTDPQGEPDSSRYLSQKERDEFSEFAPFVAAVCNVWLHHPPELPTRWQHAGIIMKRGEDGDKIDRYAEAESRSSIGCGHTSEPNSSSSELKLCLDSVSDAAAAGNSSAIAAALIDLLWSVSDARPDLDQLPVSISRSEQKIRESGRTGDIAALGLSVKQVLTDSALNRLPKQTQERASTALVGLENAVRRRNPVGLADAVRAAVVFLAGHAASVSSLPIVQDGGSIRIGRHFRVSFSRTLRVPDDGKTYPLPAGLGDFPLHSVADFAGRVPSKWLEFGGFFLPMYQSEAMFLSFGGVSWRPNIAKVGVGKINAVTGKPWDDRIRAQEQDYLLCPEQRWLDGINAGTGFVRQFVAMPLGQGYTIEEQVTDEDRFGGIQIVAYDPKHGIFPEEDPAQAEMSVEYAKTKEILLAGTSGLPEPFRSILTMSVLGFSAAQIGSAISLSQDVVAEYQARGREAFSRSPWTHHEIYGEYLPIRAMQREGLRLLGAVVNAKVVRHLEGMLFPYLAGPALPSREEVEIGIAAGGRIKQKVIEDQYGFDAWDENAMGTVWIRLVNSKVYRGITGKCPPDKPIEAHRYQQLGVPWFDSYDESRVAVGRSHILSRIKSIFTIDQQRGHVKTAESSIAIDPDKLVEITIPSRAERITALLSAAAAAAHAGHHKNASRLATLVLDLDASNASALCIRGEALLCLGLYEDAQKDAETVIHGDSANWIAQRIRAVATLMLGMPEVALAEASVALRLSGGDAALQEIVARAETAITKERGGSV